MTKHPKGTRARILLSSVFGPYAQDDEFGSRAINPMELYHNQVTREQGAVLAAHVPPLLGHPDDPAEHLGALHGARFPHARALRARADGQRLRHRRHLVASSSTSARCARCAAWCGELSPQSDDRGRRPRGRHSGIEHMIDADHIVRGEGISWMRRYLGEDENAPIQPSRDRLRLRRPHAGHANCREPRARPRPPSSLRWAAPWAATSAPPRRSSAARASTSTSTTPATSCST